MSEDLHTTRTETANAEKIVGIAKDIEYIKVAMDDLKKLMNEFKDGYVSKDEFNALLARVNAIENTMTWITRIVIGAVVSAILALVLISK